MSIKKRFKRKHGHRAYKKVFFLSVEGKKTEKDYFNIIRKYCDETIHVKCIKKNNKSSPMYVLKSMKKFLNDNNLKENDEAWLVIDKDNWEKKHLKELLNWSTKEKNYGLAVSNPFFEYWLLLHFCDGNNITLKKDITKKLKDYMLDYDKSINEKNISKSQISDATKRAKDNDIPPCKGWPEKPGSTVYKLIEKMIPDIK